MNPPNILYFVCHDLGRQLGCYGLPVSTHCLDRFAAEGIRFTRAFCSSPACSPSRACAMTGRHAHNTGAIGLSHMGWPLDLRHRTIIDDLNAAGYETILSGVNHERHPRTDRYQTDLTRTWADWQSDRAVDHAIAYLESRGRSRPFYLNIGTQEPHQVTWKDVGTRIPGPVPPEETAIPLGFPDTPRMREEMSRFQASAAFMDHHFGRLMEALDRLGLRDNTLVVFTTDHGISGPRAKGTLFDFGTEIALLVRNPGGKGAGTVSDALIPNIDFRPTLCQAAGTVPEGPVNGRSFFPLLNGEPWTPNAAAFFERNFHGEHKGRHEDGYQDAFDPVRSIRTTQYHYIRWWRPEQRRATPRPWEVPGSYQPDGPGFQHAWPEMAESRPHEALYDTARDPQEWINLAGRPEYREVKDGLAARLEQWMRETDDFLLRGEVPAPPEPSGWGPAWPA